MIEQIILRLISGEPMKRGNILKVIRAEGHMITDRTLRTIVEDMVTKQEYCISSSEKGYHLIKSEEELNRAVSYLDKKAASIAVRKNSLTANFRKQKGILNGQINLFK